MSLQFSYQVLYDQDQVLSDLTTQPPLLKDSEQMSTSTSQRLKQQYFRLLFVGLGPSLGLGWGYDITQLELDSVP